ncbi:MAG TPA: hypothetical protein VF607_01040 [Verrucomicrobiae bacterium]
MSACWHRFITVSGSCGSRNGWWLIFCCLWIGGLPGNAAESPWQRVVVLGASASAGFVLFEPFGGTNTEQCKLYRHLEGDILPAHNPVKNLSTALFFMNPDPLGEQQVAAATNQHPTLAVAVDFLFWFCYGDGDTDAERLAHLETGLELLGRLPCPLIIGDIPDASSATNTGIISADMVPTETARLQANARIKAWAAKRPHTTVVPLANFMRAAKANAAITLHQGVIPAGRSSRLLQGDGLHPTPWAPPSSAKAS